MSRYPEGLADHIRIGRTQPLSSDKSKTRFPLIREAKGDPVVRDALHRRE